MPQSISVYIVFQVTNKFNMHHLSGFLQLCISQAEGGSVPLYIKQDFEAQGMEVNPSGQHTAEPWPRLQLTKIHI